MRPEIANPRSEFAVFLTFLRRRIDPNVRDLGSYARSPWRLGKHVTQQELSEAIEVSREWYAVLESTGARPSRGLLARLADALMLIPNERAMLLHLARSAMGRVQLRDDSIAALEGYSHLRSLTKRLWSATSIEDILTTAREQIADWFDRALLVRSTRRRESGLWEHRSVDERQDRNNAAKVVRDMKYLLPTPQLQGALNLYPQLPNAGDLGTTALHPLPLQQAMLQLYSRYRVDGFAWSYARVRSRSGVIGGLYIAHEFGHSLSASDLAVLGAFAELASFALS
jgi:transcriptional regulator with XRE-family HTH domain